MGFMFLAGFLGLFFVAMLLAWPMGWVISKKLDPWPDRPMDNQERKAAWACKYHQATPIMPNGWTWPWLPKTKAAITQEMIRLLSRTSRRHPITLPSAYDNRGTATNAPFPTQPIKGNDK